KTSIVPRRYRKRASGVSVGEAASSQTRLSPSDQLSRAYQMEPTAPIGALVAARVTPGDPTPIPLEAPMIKRQTLPRMRSLHLISTALLGGLFASACSDHEPTVPRSALATAGPSATRTPVNYKFTAIDTILIPGARLISAQGINADGDIAGSYVDANLRQHGFVLHGGVVTTID